MINIDFISYKNNLKNLYNFLKSNIDFYKNFSKDKKLYKKLNKISEQKFKFKNKAKFIVDRKSVV